MWMGVCGALVCSALACSRPPVMPPTPSSPLGAARAQPQADQGATSVQLPERGELRVAHRPAAAAIQVELARTELERERGLMFRKSIADGHGMLFFMPDDNDWVFYMRNTYIPLDMIFVASDWVVVGVLENVAPLTETHRSVGRPSRYILELGAHQAAHQGIATGTRLDFTRLADGPAAIQR